MSFELFVGSPTGAAYEEYNFSPSGEWAAYGFARYRNGGAPLGCAAPAMERREGRVEFLGEQSGSVEDLQGNDDSVESGVEDQTRDKVGAPRTTAVADGAKEGRRNSCPPGWMCQRATLPNDLSASLSFRAKRGISRGTSNQD